MHNIVLSPDFTGEKHDSPANILQCFVFKRIKALLQFWAMQKIPYGKDGYGDIPDLPT